ncbi:MAG: hypothetical protein KDD10_22340 [Phaeodactylibacter sp.]|nr:hypothetical protein [Phaeodactylibacter sp.]
MNADNFSQFLEDPSLLYQASYQELKSLALQYPYCRNLHLLLFQKSYMDGSGEWEQNLEKAAAYSIDRRRLYFMSRRLDKKTEAAEENFMLSEEFLELKSLEILQLEENLLPETDAGEKTGLRLEFGPLPQEPAPSRKGEPGKALPADPEEDEEEEFEELPEISAGLAPREEENPEEKEPEAGRAEAVDGEQPALHAAPPEPAPAAFRVDEELVKTLSCLPEIIAGLTETTANSLPAPKKAKDKIKRTGKKGHRPPLLNPELAALKQARPSRPVFTIGTLGETEEAAGYSKPRPQPKQSFTSWVEQFQAPNVQTRLGELMESKKREESKRKRKKNKKNKPSRVGRLALRSITENKEILSETLAELLASQGEYQRAIEMYEALMLVFPQKSGFFAEKIENLKSK